MDWWGWLVFGLAATLTLTGTMVAAQLAGFTRMGIPFMVGTLFVSDPDRARVVGFFGHLALGQVFALFYAGAFALLDTATWWLGLIFGGFHGLAALVLMVPIMPGMHPRMASERTGRVGNLLEPPGLLGLNYGGRTPLVTMVAHLLYGLILGSFLSA